MDIRPANDHDYADIRRLVLDSFKPVTWARGLDERFGPLNGLDWRARWELRLQRIFAEQSVLVGTDEGVIAAMSSSTVDLPTALAYIDLIAVAPGRQGRGAGREMLRATIRHVQERGAKYVNLDCLTTNGNANELYESEGFEEVARHIRWFRRI